MPLYDYRCPACGRLAEDVLVAYVQPSPLMCANPDVHPEPVVMERLPCAASFHVTGFSSKNGYSGGQSKDIKIPGQPNMRVTVKS